MPDGGATIRNNLRIRESHPMPLGVNPRRPLASPQSNLFRRLGLYHVLVDQFSISFSHLATSGIPPRERGGVVVCDRAKFSSGKSSRLI